MFFFQPPIFFVEEPQISLFSCSTVTRVYKNPVVGFIKTLGFIKTRVTVEHVTKSGKIRALQKKKKEESNISITAPSITDARP